MPEGDIGGMVSSEAASQRCQARIAVLLPEKRQHFMEQIFFIVRLQSDARTRSNPPVIPALEVNRVDTIELQITALDATGERAHHTAILEFEEPPSRGGKHHDRQPCVTEDEQFHLPAQTARMPLVIFAVHSFARSTVESVFGCSSAPAGSEGMFPTP